MDTTCYILLYIMEEAIRSLIEDYTQVWTDNRFKITVPVDEYNIFINRLNKILGKGLIEEKNDRKQ